MARTHARDSGILFRDRSLLDVRRVTFHEEGHGPPRARHTAVAVRAGDAAHAHIIRHQEFPGGVAIVGVRPMEVSFVVPVWGLRRGVHDRPVGMIPEEEVRILGQFLHRVLPWSRNESLPIAFACDVPQLEGIPPAKRDLSAAVQHLAAGVEVLIDDNHGRSKVPCANSGRKPGAPCSDDNDIRLVGPFNSVGRGDLR